MIRILLAGSTGEARATLAALLAERLGDAGVLAEAPADPVAFDAELARSGEEVDALIHLGGGHDALLDHYRRAVIESPSTDPDDVLAALREAFATAAR